MNGRFSEPPPVTTLPPPEALEDLEPVAESPGWFPAITFRTALSTYASSCVALICTKRRWWAIPFFLGVGTGSVVWQYGVGIGPLTAISDVSCDWMSSVFGFFVISQLIAVWICLLATLSCVTFATFKIPQEANRFARWLEPSFINSEAGSTVMNDAVFPRNGVAPAPMSAVHTDGPSARTPSLLFCSEIAFLLTPRRLFHVLRVRILGRVFLRPPPAGKLRAYGGFPRSRCVQGRQFGSVYGGGRRLPGFHCANTDVGPTFLRSP